MIRQMLARFVGMTAVCLLGAAAPLPGQDAGYHVVHGWPLLPEGRDLGGVSGVGVAPDGNVLAFHRNARTWPTDDRLSLEPIAGPTVTVFNDRTGAVVREWGADTFAMPHGLTVDAQGDVWLTDVALQQVFKYSPDGTLLMTLGERGVAGNDSAHFDRPTKVAVAPDGSFYVSDGYRNTRVMKFSPTGKFLFQWGTRGNGPGQFELVHSVTLDDRGRVYVSDRDNARVQVFDGSGKFLMQWSGAGIGRSYDIGIGPDGTVVIADGGDQPDAPPDRSALVVARPDGSVIERVGRWGPYDGQFEIVHAIAVGPDGSVYAGDVVGNRIQKFVRGDR